MNVDPDIWGKMFGGKDTLRLYLGAHNFRIRETKSGKNATFEYGDRMKVSIRQAGFSQFYYVRLYDKGKKERLSHLTYSSGIKFVVESLTGLVLDCFELSPPPHSTQ